MIKTNLARFTNNWYKPAPKLKILLWFCANNLFINTYIPFPIFFKTAVLRFFGAKIGKGLILKPAINIKYPWLLNIGNHTWLGENVWIDNLTNVSIGNNVCISQGAMLLTGNHNFSKSTFDLNIGQIVLEDGVWIGAKAIVCPHVRCCSHAVLSAGSVASQTLEAYKIYRGNPAIFVKNRTIFA